MSFHLHVLNLRSSATSENLRQLFAGMGVVEDGVFIIGGPKGEAIVTFDNQMDLMQAIKRNGEQHLQFRVATELEILEAANWMSNVKLKNFGVGDTRSAHSGQFRSSPHEDEVQTINRKDVLLRKSEAGKRYDYHAHDQDRDSKYSDCGQHQETPCLPVQISQLDYYSNILNTVQAVTKQGYSKFDQVDPQFKHVLPSKSHTYDTLDNLNVKGREYNSTKELFSLREHSPMRQHSPSREHFLKREASLHEECSPRREHSCLPEHRIRREFIANIEYSRHSHKENVDDVLRPHPYLRNKDHLASQRRHSQGSVDPADIVCSSDHRNITQGRRTITHGRRTSQMDSMFDDKYMDSNETQTALSIGLVGPRDFDCRHDCSPDRSDLMHQKREASMVNNKQMKKSSSDMYNPRYKDGSIIRNQCTEGSAIDWTVGLTKPYRQSSQDIHLRSIDSSDHEDIIHRIEDLVSRTDKQIYEDDVYSKEHVATYQHYRRNRNTGQCDKSVSADLDLHYKSRLSRADRQISIDSRDIESCGIGLNQDDRTDRKVDIVIGISNLMDRQAKLYGDSAIEATTESPEQRFNSVSRDQGICYKSNILKTSKQTSIDDNFECSTDDTRRIINTRRKDETFTSQDRRYNRGCGARTSASSSDYPNVRKSDKHIQEKLQPVHGVYLHSKRSHATREFSDVESDDSARSYCHATKQRRPADSLTKLEKDRQYSEKSDKGYRNRIKGRYRKKEWQDARTDYKQQRNKQEYFITDASQKHAGSSLNQPRKLESVYGVSHYQSVSQDLGDIESDISDSYEQYNSMRRRREATETRLDKTKNTADGANDDKHKDHNWGQDKNKAEKYEQSRSREKNKAQTSKERLKVDTIDEEMETSQWFLAIYQIQPTTTATDVLFWCREGITAFKINFFAGGGPKGSEAMAFVLFDNKEASRNAKASIAEKGLDSRGYERHAGYRFMAQLGDTCTVTQTEYWGDRFISLEDRSQPPFVVPEFTLTETPDMVYLCVTGFYRELQLTASQIWSWFHEAKGVALAVTSRGKDRHLARVAIVAFGSADELTEGIYRVRKMWKSHKNFTVNEAMSFLAACTDSYNIKVSTAIRQDRDLNSEEMEILSNLKQKQVAVIASSIPPTKETINSGPPNPIALKKIQTSENSEMMHCKSDATSGNTKLTSKKYHTSSSKSNTPSENNSHSRSDRSSDEVHRSSGKHHATSAKGHYTSKKSDAISDMHHATSKSHSLSDKSGKISGKSSHSTSREVSFLRQLLIASDLSDSERLVLTLFRLKRQTSASQLLSRYPSGLCALKINFDTTGPRKSEALAYIIFKNMKNLPPISGPGFKYLTRLETANLLARLCGISKVSESTASGYDRALSAKDLKKRPTIAPFSLKHNLPYMHYFKLKGIDPHKNASDIYREFRGRHGRPDGVLLHVRNRDCQPQAAYIAYARQAVQRKVLASVQRKTKARITLMDEKTVFQRLKRVSDEYTVMVSTVSGQDRQLDLDEEELLGIRKNTRAGATTSKELQFLTNLQDFEQGFFIRLTKVPHKVSACDVLSWYTSKGCPATCVTLVRDPRGLAVAAFIRFEKKEERNSAFIRFEKKEERNSPIPTRKFSFRCSALARAEHLTKLRKHNTILESKEPDDQVRHSKKRISNLEQASSEIEILKNRKEGIGTSLIEKGNAEPDELHDSHMAERAEQQDCQLTKLLKPESSATKQADAKAKTVAVEKMIDNKSNQIGSDLFKTIMTDENSVSAQSEDQLEANPTSMENMAVAVMKEVLPIATENHSNLEAVDDDDKLLAPHSGNEQVEAGT